MIEIVELKDAYKEKDDGLSVIYISIFAFIVKICNGCMMLINFVTMCQ